MLRSLTLLCLTVLYASLLTGQVQLPAASAAAFAYGKYADIPVSTFTGTGNVQVPIHTVTDGPLALPISLNYHTGGLQVNVPASSVGWGWNLNTGGMISRTIKGVSDFDRHQYGYYFNGDEVRTPTGPDDKVWGYDTQPDIFTFTVGSYSGKFFLDANREIQQIPKSDIKIELRSLSDIAQGFELTTPDGTKYSYGARFKPGAGHEVITAHDYSKVNGGNWWNSPDKEEDRTGYYLLSIESADHQHRIDLEYDRMLYWYVTQQACAEEFKYRKSNGNIDQVATCEEGWMDYSIKSVYLKRIWTDNQEVTFQQETRNDVWTSQTAEARKPKRVRGITVETSGECINFDFLRSYFYDESGTKVRTKLDGVQKRSCNGSLAEPAWKFSYLGPKNGANAIGPRIDNHDIDHWGYYNYNSAKGHNDRDGDLTPQGTGMKVGGTFTPYGTANRESHEPAMLQGMLYSVTYPTGGSMQLDYEANRYQVPGPTTSGFNRSHTSLAGEPETLDTFSYYHSAEIAASPSAVWTMCIYPYGCGDDGGEPGEPGGPQYLKGAEFTEKSVATATSSSSGGSGTVEIRTLTGKYVTGFGFNTASQHCQPNERMSSHLTAGTSYKVVIRAECARVTVNLEYEGSPTEAICGGLRIKQTRVHDGISSANDVITDYAYTDKQYPSVSSGKLFRKPTYAFRVNTRTAVFTSMSQVPLFEVDGLHLGYDRVVVSQSGNGATEYKYNFPTRTQDYASYPVKPTTNELGVGELIGSTVFDDNGRTVASTTPTYRQDERESFGGGSAAGYFFVKRQGVPYYTGSLSYKNLYTPYWMTTGVRRPSTVTATVDGVSTTTEYTYHSLNLLPETVTTTNSNGDEHQQRFYFFDPTDLPFTDITQEEWEELNLKHLSYQTEQYHNGNLLDGSKTDYRFYKADGTSPSTSATDRLPVPWVYRQQHYERTYEASGSLRSGRWEIQSTVARYNAYGQIREQQTPHWPSTTVNYNGDLAISTTSSGQTTTYIYEGDDTTTPDDDTRRLEQVIAVDGTSTSYTYDDFGRVKTVTDDCRGIITTYTYSFRYNNENINFFQAEVAYPASGDNRSALTTTKTRKYTDGLGRPLQTVAIGSGASIQDDVVSGVSYDRYGRVSKTYEPLGQPNNQGAHISLATNLPGTVHTYESSPLNRLQTVTPAGLAYPTTYSYGTNIAEDGVLRDGTTTEYVAGSLRKHTVTDANGNHLITFTDKLGQQVLSRRLPAGGGASDRLDTYSVHDGKGRVRHVLPPGSTTNHTSLIYSYQYDGADQVTSKLVPGRGWTYYSYNNKHLLKGYRDERFKQAGHWYVYNYDSQGRIESEGLYKSNTLYWFLENPHISEPYITTRYGTELHEIDKVKTVRTKILNEADQWLTTTNHYTPCGLLDYQMGNNHLNISAQERTDYVYDGAGNILESTYGHRDYNQVLTNVTSEHHYDFAGRAHKSFFQVGSGARTQLNALAFNPTGQVKTKYQGGTGKSGTLAWLQKLDYTYLDDGTLQGINLDGLTGSTQGLPDFYDYDRNVHDPNPGMPSTADMDAKDLFYLELYRDRAPTTNSYNLPARYNGDITAVATQVRGRSQQIWGMTYDGYDRMRDARFYQRSNRTSTASYTSRYRATVNYDKRGNISRLDRRGMYVYPDYWKYKQIDKLVYNYVGTGTGQTNQLHHIAEGADDNLGYRERATNYAYDVNGNLSYDVQRNADIEYNHLNLPVKIAYRNGTVQRHEFTYDASGTLLTRRGYGQTGAEEHRLDYVGGIEYYNWELNTVQHEEGRVYFDDGNQRYDYVLSDHLGNARLMYSDLNGNGIPEVPSEIIEELHYYPFGMRMSGPWMASARGNQEEYVKYQYNGIERVGTYGLGLNIALYRTLDPITGRWWQVDPKAEAVKSHSPYVSMGNSPMLNSDPDGDLFFAIPQIGFSNGKLSVGLEVGVGVPGVLSASVTGGVGGGGGYWSIQGSAAGLYAGYGSSGAFAGFGYQYAGFSGGVSFGAGGPSIGIGYGGGFGNGYAGSLGISYGKGGFGYSAGVSSTYMWGTIDPGISAQGDGALAQGNPGDDVGNQGLYENETEAYNVMVEQTQNSGVENAAWLTTEGVLLSPYKTSVYTNTPTGSSNSYYKLDIRGKRLFAINNANGREYRVTGQAHTHPSVNIGLSKADRKLSRSIGGMPVYSIGPRLTHRGHFNSRGDYFMNFYTNTSNLLNGKVGLLGQ